MRSVAVALVCLVQRAVHDRVKYLLVLWAYYEPSGGPAVYPLHSLVLGKVARLEHGHVAPLHVRPQAYLLQQVALPPLLRCKEGHECVPCELPVHQLPQHARQCEQGPEAVGERLLHRLLVPERVYPHTCGLLRWLESVKQRLGPLYVVLQHVGLHILGEHLQRPLPEPTLRLVQQVVGVKALAVLLELL